MSDAHEVLFIDGPKHLELMTVPNWQPINVAVVPKLTPQDYWTGEDEDGRPTIDGGLKPYEEITYERVTYDQHKIRAVVDFEVPWSRDRVVHGWVELDVALVVDEAASVRKRLAEQQFGQVIALIAFCRGAIPDHAITRPWGPGR